MNKTHRPQSLPTSVIVTTALTITFPVAVFLYSNFTWSKETLPSSSFEQKCPDIAACAKTVSELLGQKYIYDTDVKGRPLSTPNL